MMHRMIRELKYPANWLSLLRLGLVMPTLRWLWHPNGERKALAALAFGMATDAIDGPLARSRGEVSELGKLLDPIADKLTLDGVALVLSLRRRLPWWVPSVLLGRDAAIVTGSTVIIRRSAKIEMALPSGKATTLSLTSALGLYLFGLERWGRRVLSWSLIPLAVSWVQYGLRFWHWFRSERSQVAR